MDRSPIKSRAFTLIELLVAVAIIALLVAILIPSLAAAREKARNVTCLSNLHSDGIALFNYAALYAGRLPDDGLTEGDLLWDLNGNMTDNVMGTNGIIRKTYYCPLNSNQNVDNLWAQPGGNGVGSPITHRALGYFYFIKRGNKSASYLTSSFNPPTQPKYAKSSTTPVTNSPDDQELITDIIISDTASTNFSAVQFDGGGGVTLSSSHMGRSNKPSGSNILYLDSHADNRKFSATKARINSAALPPPVGAFIEWF